MLSLDKWGLQITPAAVGGVEGARRKVLLPVFYEWLPEGSYDNSSQPCPSRSLTSSTPLQQNGMAYQLTQWGVISTHPVVSGHNIGRSWNEIVVAGTHMSSWNSLSLDVGHRTFLKVPCYYVIVILLKANEVGKHFQSPGPLLQNTLCVSAWMMTNSTMAKLQHACRIQVCLHQPHPCRMTKTGRPENIFMHPKGKISSYKDEKSTNMIEAYCSIWLHTTDHCTQTLIFIPVLTVISFFSLFVLLFTCFTHSTHFLYCWMKWKLQIKTRVNTANLWYLWCIQV